MNKRMIEEIISRAIERGLQAGAVHASGTAKDAFKATERRLYALPILEKKLKIDIESLEEIKGIGLKGRSKDIQRFNRTGYRISPEDLADAIRQDLEATISQTEHEIKTVYTAMEAFADDDYYETVTAKYVQRHDDEDVAKDLGCGTTMIWKQRTRIVKDIAVMLYGVSAV